MMKKIILYFALLATLFISVNILSGQDAENHMHYLSISRFTDPKEFSSMLKELPKDVTGICEIAEKQIVHHNLLIYNGIPYSRKYEMNNTWPPRMADILKALKNT